MSDSTIKLIVMSLMIIIIGSFTFGLHVGLTMSATSLALQVQADRK